MPTWKEAFREGAVSGTVASVLSAAYLAWAGRRRGKTAAPVNAVSHWFFGDRSLHRDGASLKYTLNGYLIHHAASIFWAVLHAKAWGAREEAKEPVPLVAGAVVAASVACVVDLELTPERLTPGFEHRLGRPELANVYAWFAVGLALGSVMMRGRRR